MLENSFYSSFNSFFLTAVQNETTQRKLLVLGLKRNKSMYSYSQKFGGFVPHFSAESELVRRVKKAGLASYLVPCPQVTVDEQHSALEVGESLMTNRRNINFSMRRLARAAYCVRRALVAPNFKVSPHTVDLALESLNKTASSGYPYYKRKGLVLDKLRADFNRVPMSSLLTYPTMRSFRAQLRTGDAPGSLVAKLRVIYPYPGLMTLHEMRFVQPLVDYFVQQNSPYITGKSGGFVGSNIMKYAVRRKYNISSDISKYDQNLPNEIIHSAFGVIRTMFSLTKGDCEHFENIEKYFISSCLSSRVGKNKGKTIVKTNGIPSGSGFTNLIGTISHMIILCYYDEDFFVNNFSMICSDDNLTFTDDKKLLDFSVIKQIYGIWGLSVNPDKYDVCYNADRVFFLGFEWLRGVRVIDPKLSLNQLVYHTDFITDLSFYDRVVARSASVLLNGANGRSYFEKLFPEIAHMLYEGKDMPFNFLPRYSAPGTGRSIILAKPSARQILSLREHFFNGWRIR